MEIIENYVLIGGVVLKLDNIVKVAALTIVCMTTATISANAHGKDNSIEGHKDYLNQSGFGIGVYHYHHGYEAHLHDDNGKCNFKEEEAKKEGYNKGYDDAYVLGLSEYNYEYTDKLYLDAYKKSYNEGFKKGEAKLEPEIEPNRQLGYDTGKQGHSQVTKTYKNIKLNKAYIEGHREGYKAYIEEQSKEKYNMGFSDGKNNLEKKIFEHVESQLIEEYNIGYEEGREKYLDSITEEGYKDALNDKDFSSMYTNDGEKSKYKEGYDKGTNLKEEIYIAGKNAGYNKKAKTVPEEYKIREDLFNQGYEEGLNNKETELNKEKEAKKTQAIIRVLPIIVVAFIVLVVVFIVLKLRKNKKNNNMEDSNI